jgi:hypothetical protein
MRVGMKKKKNCVKRRRIVYIEYKVVSKVDDASHSLDDDKRKSNEREEDCKKNAE